MKNIYSKIILLSIVLVLLGITNEPLLGNSERSLQASNSVSEIRPQGQRRVWTFTHRGQQIGHLVTEVKGVERINGRQATVISDSLFVDYQKISAGATLSLWGKQFVSSMGTYLGTELTLAGADANEELSLRVAADPDRKVITGYFTRDGRKLNRTLPITRDMFGWDIHLLDQLELWLSMQSFSVGDTLVDTLFSPQSLLTTPVYGIVDQFMYRELYRNKFDSVFIIELEKPQPMQLTFSPRKELVRVDFKELEIRAYLDYIGRSVQKGVETKSKSSGITLGTFIRWSMLLFMGLITLLLLATKGKKSIETGFGLLLGGGLSALLLLVMTPLQSWLIDTLLDGVTSNSNSFYYLWLVPTLVLALLQEGCKAGGIYLSVLWRNPKEYLLVSIGAAFGVGFALIETGYQSQTYLITSIFDWSLLGQLFLILFHGTAGALVGWAILENNRTLITAVGIALIINSLIHYLPSLVIKGVMEQQLVHLGTAMISLLFLLTILLIQRRKSVE